ncbi:MAG: DUF2164 family protein [SAR324 cluster bacterium]|nr:DUF2164 family protein [SAR324 cluster bacterium]
MKIRLSEDRHQSIITAFVELYQKEFDEELSPYRAETILEFFVQKLGPVAYNQAIQDARSFILRKMEDLDSEFYFPEEEG